jgi:poly-beta-hydroxyalkanoate depolymerase
VRYQTFETYTRTMRVWHEWFNLGQHLNNLNPLAHTPFCRAQNAFLEMGLRVTQHYEKQGRRY